MVTIMKVNGQFESVTLLVHLAYQLATHRASLFLGLPTVQFVAVRKNGGRRPCTIYHMSA